MNIKNALIGVTGAGFLAASLSLSANVNLQINDDLFVGMDKVNYIPVLRRFIVDGKYLFLDCTTDSEIDNELSSDGLALELKYLNTATGSIQIQVFPVGAIQYSPGTRTLSVNSGDVGQLNCGTELLHWDNFQG